MNTSEETTCAASVSSPGTRILRSFPLIALIFFMLVMDAPTLGGEVERGSTSHSYKDRVMSLIVHLANQAHLSQDIQFAVRAQSQAGLLIWPHDRDKARAIFRRAFQQLLPSACDSQPVSPLERAKRQQFRVELLNQIAYCDPAMAETLARSFFLSRKDRIYDGGWLASADGTPAFIASRVSVDAESRDLMVGVALRVAEVDSGRAMQLGRLSLEAGISPYFDRLLILIGKTAPALADHLFSNSVDYLERAGQVSPGDLHALSFYLISSVGASDKERREQAVIVRFLNLAFDFVMRNCPVNKAIAPRNAKDQSFEIYCIGKYLMELLPRYLPDRAARLQSRLPEPDDREPPGKPKNLNVAQSIHPSAIEQVARNNADARERDLLYAKAAFGWLAIGDMREAQRAASNISSAEMRDRALLRVARRLVSKSRIKDALVIVPLIQDRVAKTDLIVRLAQAAFSLRNTACAKTLLDLAELEAAKIEGPFVRVKSLLAIVDCFSPFNTARAFAVMQEAVRSINEIPARELHALNLEGAPPCAANAQTEGLFQLIYASSLTALARLDFDQALLLSQQITDKEISLIAQLAVCRGGMRLDGFQKR